MLSRAITKANISGSRTRYYNAYFDCLGGLYSTKLNEGQGQITGKGLRLIAFFYGVKNGAPPERFSDARPEFPREDS